jgi:hypothetical protein
MFSIARTLCASMSISGEIHCALEQKRKKYCSIWQFSPVLRNIENLPAPNPF